MTSLLRKPIASHGLIHDLTPASANWQYVGFSVHKLQPGESVDAQTGDREVILVLVEGKASLSAGDTEFGELGQRLNVFEKTPPHCVYVPGQSHWQATATTDCTLAVCSAPAKTSRDAAIIGPSNIQLQERGKGTNLRYINNIAMEDRDVADSLLVTEVFTPTGHWSSYPPHRHDVDDFPNITYLEETYYHRLNPSQGYGHQRVFTEDGSLDQTLSFSNEDVVLVPKGHHPCAPPMATSCITST